LLNYLEEVNRRNGKRDRRFRLVHAQVLAPEDFKRLGQLGVVAEVQPFHLSDDMRWMEEGIGAERSKGAYAFKSIQASVAILSLAQLSSYLRTDVHAMWLPVNTEHSIRVSGFQFPR
jgi:predicted amidohydrolase YtcJ